jgi:hypothetical protein
VIPRRANVMSGLALTVAGAILLGGCSGLGTRRTDAPPAERLARIAGETGSVEKVEGRGKARIENRLGEVEIEFDMTYEPGRVLKIDGELAPGFLPFHGDVELTSTPDTMLAYVNGMPLVPRERSYPGDVVHPALVAILLGGDWVLAWLEAQGCEVGENLTCGEIGFEFDLDSKTGHVKAWTLEHKDPNGSYDGFLYRSRSQGRIELPEILTGMAHPFEVAVYVEYYQISATIR